MTMIADKPFTQFTNVNILDELRIRGVLVDITDPYTTYIPRLFISVIIDSDYSAIAGDWIEAVNGISILLPADADENDEVIVTNGDGSLITINSGAVNIKYTSTVTSLQTTNQGTTLHFQMFSDGVSNYWRIR